MRKKILLLFLLLIGSLFYNTRSVLAKEESTSTVQMETYCRYQLDGVTTKNSFLLIIQIWLDIKTDIYGFLLPALDFYDMNKLGDGIKKSTVIDVVLRSDHLLIVTPKSTSLYANISGNAPSSLFYYNGDFRCAPIIFGKYLGKNSGRESIEIYETQNSIGESDSVYVFKKIAGPETRPISDDNLVISDSTCTGILGSFKKDLEGILKIIRLVAPLLVLILGTYDYCAGIFSKDADLLKKANDKLKKRLILIATLFFLPTILNIILGIIDASYISCIG